MIYIFNAITALILVWLIRWVVLRLWAISTFSISSVPSRPWSIWPGILVGLFGVTLPIVLGWLTSEPQFVFGGRLCVLFAFLLIWLFASSLDFREIGLFHRQTRIAWDQIRGVDVEAQQNGYSLICIRSQWAMPFRVWIPGDRQEATVRMIRGAARFERRPATLAIMSTIASASLWGLIFWGLFSCLPI